MGLYFLKLGANLIITSRKLDVLEGTAKEMESETGGQVLPLACDVRDIEQVERCLPMLWPIWRSGCGAEQCRWEFYQSHRKAFNQCLQHGFGYCIKGTSNHVDRWKHWIKEKQPGTF